MKNGSKIGTGLAFCPFIFRHFLVLALAKICQCGISKKKTGALATAWYLNLDKKKRKRNKGEECLPHTDKNPAMGVTPLKYEQRSQDEIIPCTSQVKCVFLEYKFEERCNGSYHDVL